VSFPNVETQHCSSVLLLNATQNFAELLRDKFKVKADDSFTVDAALGKIRKSLTDRSKCGCGPFSVLVIDAEKEINIPMLKHLATKIAEIYA
jgi:hypothetical protein